jgi:hypothetical protein
MVETSGTAMVAVAPLAVSPVIAKSVPGSTVPIDPPLAPKLKLMVEPARLWLTVPAVTVAVGNVTVNTPPLALAEEGEIALI